MLAASKRKGSRVPVSWLSCLGTGPAKQPQAGGHRCVQMPCDSDREGCDDPRSCQQCVDTSVMKPALGGRTKSPSPVMADRVCPSLGASVHSICRHLKVPLAGTDPSCPALAFCVLEGREGETGSPRGANITLHCMVPVRAHGLIAHLCLRWLERLQEGLSPPFLPLPAGTVPHTHPTMAGLGL